jgi:hypothetical protein
LRSSAVKLGHGEKGELSIFTHIRRFAADSLLQGL